MIMGAAVLVLLGLGFFVAGIVTGTVWLYWACVAACAVAAVLIVLARRQLSASRPGPAEQTPAAPFGPDSGGSTARPADLAEGDAAPVAATSPPGAAAAAAAAPTSPAAAQAPEELEDPPVEEVEVTDLLMVVDLTDEVLVIDEHPRYHLAGCAHLTGRTPIPLPLDEARTDG